MQLPDFLAPDGPRDTALVVLAVVVAALLVLSLLFAAYTLLLRAGHRIRDRRWAELTARWEGPLLAALADPELIPQVHALVDRRSRLHFVHFVLDYHRRLTGAERTALERLVAPYLEPLVARARHRHAEVRTRAVQTLGALGLPRYADAVVAALDDESPLVAMVAATALARTGDGTYAQAILKGLHRFDTWSPTFLASMLARMGPSGAADLRATLADTDEAPRVRAVAARALAELPDLQAAPLAATVIEEETAPDLLSAALGLLTKVGAPEHASAIRARCASPDPVVRAAALRALGTVGRDEDVPRLLGALSDPSPWVAISAARGLYDAGGEGVLADLRDSDHPRALLAAQILMEQGA